MNISYSRPLELGWKRMKRTLFQPFNLGRWMVLGFTAWLAQLADGSGGSSGAQDAFQMDKDVDPDNFSEAFGSGWGWLTDFVSTGVGVVLVTLAVVAVLVITVLLIWLSSRGRFMFLDNLVHDRTEVTQPWRDFQRHGDSLFLWTLGYSILAMMIVGALVLGLVIVLVPAVALDLSGGVSLLLAMALGTIFFAVIVILSYVEYFLHYFVVPIMYKHGVSTSDAWRIFLPVFQAHPGSFIVFGLFYLVVSIGMGLALLIAGLMTCCLGFILMVLPYLGAVVTLPITVLARFMNLEFLAQFGDDFTLLTPLTPVDPPHPYSGYDNVNGTVVGPEDISEDTGGDESGPQGP
jgi:hypothetical protein